MHFSPSDGQCQTGGLKSSGINLPLLLADRGYDADWIRNLANQYGAWANIPSK
jgi:hypothetical protein